MALLGLLFIPW